MTEPQDESTLIAASGAAISEAPPIQPVTSWISRWRQPFQGNTDPNPSQLSKSSNPPIPLTNQARLNETLNEAPLETSKLPDEVAQSKDAADRTILYLAYGSNLCREAFQKTRGIRPLSMRTVVVPELTLMFDLPGIPYTEPCFANTRYRDQSVLAGGDTQKEQYRKDKWSKGLVGVVWEVTLKDYTHIIATEGGGVAYRDVLVDCYPLPADPNLPVPDKPSTAAFKAHTLLAPKVGRLVRPDRSYAQPSPRYLKLLTDGAMEVSLPNEYQEYLRSIGGYRVTSTLQFCGKLVFGLTWGPPLGIIFSSRRAFTDKKGHYPKWLAIFTGFLFKSMWASYDAVFKRVFGDGERTLQAPVKKSH